MKLVPSSNNISQAFSRIPGFRNVLEIRVAMINHLIDYPIKRMLNSFTIRFWIKSSALSDVITGIRGLKLTR